MELQYSTYRTFEVSDRYYQSGDLYGESDFYVMKDEYLHDDEYASLLIDLGENVVLHIVIYENSTVNVNKLLEYGLLVKDIISATVELPDSATDIQQIYMRDEKELRDAGAKHLAADAAELEKLVLE